ncbi:hypothetical protein LMG7053_00552 [Achromobacter ruhlandii]|uniref:DUF4148 domain-containing protein n=1 Tax=Achromobacter ruhlandii TaxID=72557 RepID=A0ABM8LPE5_9BURK|nr:hypothetical protein LMG7053_00552 [Achromobacter ruhlandii]
MKTLATALMLSMSVLAAAGAQAAEADQGPTRAQVQAELQQAKVSGQYTFGEEGYPAAIAQKSSLTSQQVQEQLAQAKNAGEVTFGNMDYPPVAHAASTTSLSRSQVQTELAQAKAEGLVTFGNMDYPPHGQLIAWPGFQALAIAPQKPSGLTRRAFLFDVSAFN